jgi:1-acyl-sn-glycerol-3-phosphate acyltransferase
VTLVRSLLFNVCFSLWTIFISVMALPTLLISQRATIWISELWASVTFWLLLQIVGLSHEVRGRYNVPEGAVIVALKHQSAWEAIALWVLVKKPAIVLKQSLTRIPVFGLYMRRGGAIVIDRDAGPKALRPMVAAARAAAIQGRPIMIFPEGTRTREGARQAYQPGIAALYMQLHLLVIPVALNSGLFWGRRSFRKRPGRILVEFLRPIEPGLDRRSFMLELERRIEDATALLIAESKRVENISRSAIVAF